MNFYMGVIYIAGFGYSQQNTMPCSGQLISIAANSALFALLGTTYGGDGQTTFALPDLRGRAIIGAGQGQVTSMYYLGQMGGNEQVTLVSNNLPSHSHPLSGVTGSISGTASATMSVENGGGDDTVPANNYLAVALSSNRYSTTSSGSDTLNSNAISVNTTGLTVNMGSSATGTAGNNMPVSTIEPYLALNYSIATEGIFPSRN